MAQAYKPYVDYLTAGGVAETAYIVSKQGAICATNLPIAQFPAYNFEIEDDKDPNKKHNIVVNEGANLLDAMAHKGRPKCPADIRLYNQKYYTVRFDEEANLLYLKKVITYSLRNTEEPASPQQRTSSSSAPSTPRIRCSTRSMTILKVVYMSSCLKYSVNEGIGQCGFAYKDIHYVSKPGRENNNNSLNFFFRIYQDILIDGLPQYGWKRLSV